MRKSIRSASLSAALALAVFGQNQAKADITTGLVGNWAFHDGAGSSMAADSSGEGDNGTLTGFSDSSFTSMWVNGIYGGGILFNNGATGNYVAVTNQPWLNFNATNNLQFTVSAWVNCSVAGASETGAILGHGTGGGGEEYVLDFSGGKFRFFLRNATGTAATAVSSVAPTANTWYHLTGVFSGQSTNKQEIIYINGISNSAPTTALPTSLPAATTPINIGNRLSSTSLTSYTLPFLGIVDDVRIYNRAFSKSDVLQLYENNGNAPTIITQPRSISCYLGDTPAFLVAAEFLVPGFITNTTTPFTYQWQLNSTNISGATNTTLVITNAQATNAGTYTVLVTDTIGTTTSSNAVLSLQPLPPADPSTGLVGYWKFDDASGSSTAADSSTNGNAGTLTSFADTSFTTMWTNGLLNGALAFNGDLTGLDVVAIPSVGNPAPAVLDFSTSGATGSPVFTLAAWVKGGATQSNAPAIIAKGTGNGGEQYVVDLNAGHFRFFVRDSNAVSFPAASTVSILPGVWQHVVAVLNGTNGIMNLYVNGALATVGIAPFSVQANAQPMNIGNRQAGTGAYGDPFTGIIDDVHVYNRDLTAADVNALYLLAGAFPPSVAIQPQNVSAYVGDNLKLSATVGGTAPLVFQWKKNGTNISGATTSSLTFLPTAATDAGTYQLIVTNLYGSTNTAPVVVTLTPFAVSNALAGYWTFDDGPGSATALDSSTNGNNGSLQNFPDFTSEWGPGRINDGIAFNTNNTAYEFVDVPFAPSLDFNTNLDFSLAAWVKGSATQSNGACIICKGIGSLNEQYSMDVENGTFRFYLRNSANAVSTVLTPISPNGTWQHVLGTYDGNFGLMAYYVNGQLVGSNTAAPNSLLPENNHDVTIGSRESSSSSFYNLPFVGLIDDVRIYNRALSAADAQTLFQAAGLLAPVFYTQPQGASIFVGNNYTLSASVDGTAPLSLQWKLNGVSIPGATNSTLALTNAQTVNSGTYNLVVSNGVPGSVSSSNAVVQVSVFTTNTTAGVWTLDDGAGSSTAADSSGYGDTGTLNGFPDFTSDWWVPGRINGALNFDTDPSTQFTYQTYVTIPDEPQLNFNTTLAFSVGAWVRGPARQPSNAGIVCKGFGGGGEQYSLDLNTGGAGFRFYVRNGAGTAVSAASAVTPNGLWQYLAATFDGNAGAMGLYLNGVLIASNVAPTSLIANTHVVSIGCREGSTSSGYNDQFNGAIDDVRIYPQALSPSQVTALYQSAPVFGPIFYTQPQGSTNYTGTSITFSSLADGTAPLSYQWLLNSNTIAGATNSTLTLASLQTNNSGNYSVRVINSNGTNFSQSATLLVLPTRFSGGAFLPDKTFQLNFSGEPNASYLLYSTSDLTLPLSQWTVAASGNLDGNGQGTYTDPNAPNNRTQYYYLQVQLQ